MIVWIKYDRSGADLERASDFSGRKTGKVSLLELLLLLTIDLFS